MPGGLSLLTQDDWSGGMFQGPDVQRIPTNGAYDIVNGLMDVEEGVIYRRGGSAYKSDATSSSLRWIWDEELGPGQRTVLERGTLYVLDTNDSSLLQIAPFIYSVPPSSTVIDGALVIAGDSSTITVYGGSRAAFGASYATGTVTVTTGSNVVTGSGTSFSSNVVAGQIFRLNGAAGTYVIASVDSNTQLTLAVPYRGTTAAASAYAVANYEGLAASSFGGLTGVTSGTFSVGSAAGRLFVARGPRIAFADLTTPFKNASVTDYHQVPAGVIVTGLAGLRGNLMVFTTGGMYAISNPELDLTDAAGNPQQTLTLVSPETVLWGPAGIASWRNTLVVPAADGCYLVDGVSAPVLVSGPITDLWASYVAAGYSVGQATVHRGHYIVPILNGTTWVDTLVCRLQGGVWSRMSGYSGQGKGYAQRTASGASREAKLFAAIPTRVVDCTPWFSPSATYKNDADGTTHTFSVTTRDYTLSSLKGFVKKCRVWVEGVDAGADDPTLTLSYAQGPAGSSFTSLGSKTGESTGDSPLPSWTVGVGGKRVRFKVSSTSPFASLKLKALDLFVRPRGRQ